MHKHAPGIKVLWVFTLLIGLLLAGAAVISMLGDDGPVTTQQWMLIGVGSVKTLGATIGLIMFNRSD